MKRYTAGLELDVGDVAERLGIRPRMVYEAISRGELTAYKVGRRIRLAQADVDAWAASRQPS